MEKRIDYQFNGWDCWRNMFGEWGGSLSRKGKQLIIITGKRSREELEEEINKIKNMEHTFGRHGEVILKQVDKLPEGAKLVESGDRVIVGHSESGHHHVLTIPRGTGIVKMYEVDGKTYLDIPRKADLVHEKSVESHGTQTFAPGIYIREIRQSYSYAEKIMKRVVD